MHDSACDLEALKRLLVMFMAGGPEDISVEAANWIEEFFATSLTEDHELQEFADSLAQYRPEGGDYLYSYEQMRPLAQDGARCGPKAHWLNYSPEFPLGLRSDDDA